MNILKEFHFYLISFGIFLIILERLIPWRASKLFRKRFSQDLFWLVFNGYIFGILLVYVDPYIYTPLNSLFMVITGVKPELYNPFSKLPFFVQIITGLLIIDFLEYWLHRLLHSSNLLWRIHKLHHSIKNMDWIGNMRFHPFEIIFYKYLKYFPLLFLGFFSEVYLWTGVISLGIGYLNHANLKWNYGLLRYILNSPRMHIFHHDIKNHFKWGQNFAVVFSLWDFLFKTAHMPDGQPDELGFKGDTHFPENVHMQFLSPFLNIN